MIWLDVAIGLGSIALYICLTRAGWYSFRRLHFAHHIEIARAAPAADLPEPEPVVGFQLGQGDSGWPDPEAPGFEQDPE